MSSIINYACNIGSEIAEKISETVTDLTGTRPHNIVDPLSAYCVVRTPTIPMCASIPNGSLEVGTLILVTGTIPSSFTKRFNIDFIVNKCKHVHGTVSNNADNPETQLEGQDEDKRDVAFHFNPRFNGGGSADGFKDIVVMNSRMNGQWDDEIRDHRFPFEIGVPFKLTILVEEECFKVAVNGNHMYEFKHRYDFRNIARIHIEGNIFIDLIEFRKELKYLRKNSNLSSSSSSSSSDESVPDQTNVIKTKVAPAPTIPYTEYDPLLGKTSNIYIAGMMPTHVRENFVINLASTGNKFPVKNVPLHISIRPDHQTIVRNTMYDGQYGDEELYMEGVFPFVPGAHFDMMICNKADRASVAINGQLVFEYKHRMNASIIDTVEIHGSIVLSSVRYEFYQK